MTLGSAVLGASDHLYPLTTRYKPAALRFFNDGFGDLDNLERSIDFFREWLEADGPETTEINQLSTDFSRRQHTMSGSFSSPVAAFLPAESRDVPFTLLLPRGGPPRAVVLLLPGTADQTFLYRRLMFAPPLLNAGIACLIAQAPFYGERRPAGQVLHYLRWRV